MHHSNSRSVVGRPSVSCAGRAVRWALCAVALAATFYLLAFGVAVFLGAPPCRLGEGFWRPEKFVYGLLPVLATPAILAITARHWVRQFAQKRNAWLTLCGVAVFAIPLDAIVFLKLRGRQEERIHLDWRKESAVFSWGTDYMRRMGE